MAAARFEDPDSLRCTWETHWISNAYFADSMFAYCVPQGAAGQGSELSQLPLEDFVVSQIEPVDGMEFPQTLEEIMNQKLSALDDESRQMLT
jgi:hypothetical protein